MFHPITPLEYVCLKDRQRRIGLFMKTVNRHHVTVADRPADLPYLTRDQVDAMSVYEFIRDRPTHYKAFLSADQQSVEAFFGAPVGRVVRQSPQFRNNFSALLRPLVVLGVNGILYHGFAYAYRREECHLSAYKNQRAAREMWLS